MTERRTSLRCAGCGWEPPEDRPLAFRCPNAGSDDADHVITRTLRPGAGVSWPSDESSNPFVRYRGLLFGHDLALAGGMRDGEFVDLAERLDKEIGSVDGRGFVETPFARADQLSDALGFVRPGGV